MNLEEEIKKLSDFELDNIIEVIDKRKFEIKKENEINHAKTNLRIAESMTFEESKRSIDDDEFDYTHR